MQKELVIPFTDNSKSIVSKYNISISNPYAKDLSYVQKELEQILQDKNLSNPDNYEKQILLYPYSRIILSIINKSYFYEKFSNYYYKISYKESLFNPVDFLQYLGIEFDLHSSGYKISITDYTFAKIRSDKDKLVNKVIDDGYVFLSNDEVSDFIGRFVSAKVIVGMPLDVSGVSRSFNECAKKIESKIQKNTIKSSTKYTGPINYESFPPCMNHIMAELVSGNKPNHMARYYFATYMFSLNIPLETINEVFSRGKDYKEDVTLYQLNKIKGYAPPLCNTLKSMGLCFENEFCKQIKSPTEYYFKYNKDNYQKETNVKLPDTFSQ